MSRLKLASTVAFIGLIAQPALAAASDWNLDPYHSSVNFTVRHMMVSNVHGSFGKVSATAKYDGKDLKGAEVEAKIETASINTSDEKRDGHLKSPDFFDAAKYPSITFKSKSVKPAKGGFDIEGDLTMHGVTKPVTLHAEKLSDEIKDKKGDVHVGTSATAKVNRKDFGISWGGQLDNGGAMVGDEVNVTIDVDLVKAKEAAPAK